jgi:hypothetical protein
MQRKFGHAVPLGLRCPPPTLVIAYSQPGCSDRSHCGASDRSRLGPRDLSHCPHTLVWNSIG